jgi:predicted ArsR family transcriptional regulator
MNIALNDSPKGRVLYLLRGAGGGTAQDVADALGVTVPAARRHLGDLLEAGLIESATHLRPDRQRRSGLPKTLRRIVRRYFATRAIPVR